MTVLYMIRLMKVSFSSPLKSSASFCASSSESLISLSMMYSYVTRLFCLRA